jgi:hypothetical protein
MKLGLWLKHAGQKIFGEVLGHYMVDMHIQSSIKDALHTIVSGVSLMQSQNINLCLTVERAIAPTLLNELNKLMLNVLEVGLDHDVES